MCGCKPIGGRQRPRPLREAVGRQPLRRAAQPWALTACRLTAPRRASPHFTPTRPTPNPHPPTLTQLAIEKGHRLLGLNLAEYSYRRRHAGRERSLLARLHLSPIIWGLILGLLAMFQFNVLQVWGGVRVRGAGVDGWARLGVRCAAGGWMVWFDVLQVGEWVGWGLGAGGRCSWRQPALKCHSRAAGRRWVVQGRRGRPWSLMRSNRGVSNPAPPCLPAPIPGAQPARAA